jgi:hypothetical protein
MLTLLWSTPALAADIPVGAGKSIARAIGAAADGDVVIVAAGADASGTASIDDVAITVRSATDERVEIPALLVSDASVHLEHVAVRAADRGAYSQVMAVYSSTITGDDVAFSESAVYADLGVVLDDATFEVTRLRLEGFSGKPFYPQAASVIHLTDARVYDMTRPLVDISQIAFGTEVIIDGGVFESNPSPYGLFIVEGNTEGKLTIRGATFLDNGTGDGNASVASVLSGAATFIVERSLFCGNRSPSLEAGDVGALTLHRDWFGVESGAAVELHGPGAITHTTFTQAGLAVDVPVTLTNTLLVDAEVSGPLVGDHVGWFSEDAVGTDGAVVTGTDPGFDPNFDPTGCDVPPWLAAGSPAIDMGNPALPLEDGDVGAPDLGAFPFVAGGDDGGDDGLDTDPWLEGSAGCEGCDGLARSSVLHGSIAIAAAAVMLLRRSRAPR